MIALGIEPCSSAGPDRAERPRAADALALCGVALLATAAWIVLVSCLPALAAALLRRDPAWSAICAAGLGGALDPAKMALAWSQSFALWCAMIAALTAPLAAPWRRLRHPDRRNAGDWAAFAAYVGAWIAAGGVASLGEAAARALSAEAGATFAAPQILSLLLAAAAVQRLAGSKVSVHAGVGETAAAAGVRGGLAAGIACVRANALAMIAMCVAGAVSLSAFAVIVAVMACDRLAPRLVTVRLGGVAFAFAAAWTGLV